MNLTKEQVLASFVGAVMIGTAAVTGVTNYLINLRHKARVEALTMHDGATFTYHDQTPLMSLRRGTEEQGNKAYITVQDGNLAIEFNFGYRKRDDLWDAAVQGGTSLVKDGMRNMVGMDPNRNRPSFREMIKDAYSFQIVDIGANGIDTEDQLIEWKYDLTPTLTEKITDKATAAKTKIHKFFGGEGEIKPVEESLEKAIQNEWTFYSSTSLSRKMDKSYRSLVDQAYNQLIKDQK